MLEVGLDGFPRQGQDKEHVLVQSAVAVVEDEARLQQAVSFIEND